MNRDQPSTLMTMTEAAAYLCYTGPRAAEAVRIMLRKHGVKLYRPGLRCLVRRSAIDAMLEQRAHNAVDETARVLAASLAADRRRRA
jgi:hypothetical protein